MSVGTVVRAACKSIFAGRFYADTFIQRDSGLPRWPAGRFVIVSGVNEATNCGTDDETTDDTRVQIDVVSKDHDERETLLAQVITAMMGLDPPCYRDSLFRTYDEQTSTYRATLDYVFQPSSVEES